MFHEYKKNPPLNAGKMLSQATIKRLSLLNRIIHQYHSRTVNNRNSVPVFFSVLTKNCINRFNSSVGLFIRSDMQ